MQWRDFDCPICSGKQTLKERFYFNSHGNGMIYWKCEKCRAESDSFESFFINIAEMLVSVQPSKEENYGFFRFCKE